MGHNFRIGMEDDTHPLHKPLYKLSPLELEEVHKYKQYMLEHGFIHPSNSLYGIWVLFALKKMVTLGFASAAIG